MRFGAVSLLTATLATTASAGRGGGLDATFDGDGRLVADLGGSEFVVDAVVQPDGRIVVVGSRETTELGSGDFLVARYRADGSPDPSFDGDGVVLTNVVRDDTAHAVALQPDGKILVVGSTAGLGVRPDFALARYESDGRLDAGFGAGGIATADFGDTVDVALAVALGSDGRIVAAGPTRAPGSGQPEDFAIARFNANGTPDTSFDDDGRVVTNLAGFDRPLDVAVQAEGKVVASGFTGEDVSGDFSMALVRYETGGALDASFAV